MAGLLDMFDDPSAQIGLGLLAAASPRADAAGFGQRLMEGVQGAQGMRNAAMQRQMQMLQFNAAMRKNQMINDALAAEGGQPPQGQPQQDSGIQVANNSPVPLNSTLGSGTALIGSTNPAPVQQSSQPATQTRQPWSANKINLFAMSGDPGLQKAAELEQARQLAGKTDFTKLLDAANIDANSPLGKQLLQQQITNANTPKYTRLGEAAYADSTGIHGLPSAPKPGYQNLQDANGNWYTQEIGGGKQAVTDSAEAEKLGSQKATPTVAYDEKGNPVFSTAALDVSRANPNAPTLANAANLPANNPGNIRPQGSSTGFQSYSSPADGLAAIDQNLQAYGKKGINTVSGVISRWAPPSENNTAAYIADVSQRLGVKPDQQIDLSNPMVRQALSTGIMLHEQGPAKVFGSSGNQSNAAAPASPTTLRPANPAGFATGQEAAQTELSQKWTKLSANNSEAQNTISYLKSIKDQATKAAVGPLSDKLQYVNGLLASAGLSDRAMDATTANNLLDKYSNQIITRLGQGGLGTDAARSMLQAAYPNSHMTADAINEASDNLIGANKMLQSRTQILQPHANARDPVAYSNNEVQFDKNADPGLFANASKYAQLKAINPAKAKEFAQQVVAKDPSFGSRMQALESIGVKF